MQKVHHGIGFFKRLFWIHIGRPHPHPRSASLVTASPEKCKNFKNQKNEKGSPPSGPFASTYKQGFLRGTGWITLLHGVGQMEHPGLVYGEPLEALGKELCT